MSSVALTEAGFQHLVFGDDVDGDFVFLPDNIQLFPHLGVVKRFGGRLDAGLAGIGGEIRVEGIHQVLAEVFQAEAVGEFADALLVFFGGAMRHAGEPAGHGAEHVFFFIAQRHRLHQFLERDRGLFLHGLGVGHVLLADADGIHNHEMILGLGVRGDGLEVVRLETRTPRPFICSKKARDFTARMNMTISTGLMSVPVAIMSTVTAIRGL